MIDWILARLSENSTWRGIILLVTAAGVKIRPDLIDSIIAIGLSLVAIINIVRKAPANEVPTTVTTSISDPK